jgi:hypothetical protein
MLSKAVRQGSNKAIAVLAKERLPHACLAVLRRCSLVPQLNPTRPPSTSATANMVDSDSSLSSAPSTDDEMPVDVTPANASKLTPQKKKQGNILTFFKQKERTPSPPRKKREPSPEHIYGPQDNPDIAVRTGRVNRVPSRRDSAPDAVIHYLRAMLTFYATVHCHVPLTIQRCFSSWRAACWTSGYRARCCGRSAVRGCRGPPVRPARLGPQSQEACRVSPPPVSFVYNASRVA